MLRILKISRFIDLLRFDPKSMFNIRIFNLMLNPAILSKMDVVFRLKVFALNHSRLSKIHVIDQSHPRISRQPSRGPARIEPIFRGLRDCQHVFQIIIAINNFIR